MSVTSWPVRRWRIPSDGVCRAFRPDLPSSLLTPRTGRRPQARPVSRRTVCEVTTVWLGRSDWSRRDTRQRAKRLGSGPIGGGGDSPVTHRAPGYRHDCAQSRGSHQPPPSSSVRADEPFFRDDDPERRPRHTAVASPRCAGEPTLQRCRRRSRPISLITCRSGIGLAVESRRTCRCAVTRSSLEAK